jgi:hypothetical protein
MSSARRIEVVNHVKGKQSYIWCPVCEYILTSMEDVRSLKDNDCCDECWLSFGQMRQKEWKEGWRPDSETLNRYKQSRRIINIDIMKILGE